MTSTTYLDSLLYPIVSHLLEQRGRVETSEANDEPLRAIGYACCLVSRSFLPHGRRILYSHLDSRDSRDARLPNLFSFPRRIEHLVMHPHLAQFLRVCRFQIDGELEENAVALGELVMSCPNLDSFALIEKGSEESQGGTQIASREIKQSVRAIALAAHTARSLQSNPPPPPTTVAARRLAITSSAKERENDRSILQNMHRVTFLKEVFQVKEGCHAQRPLAI